MKTQDLERDYVLDPTSGRYRRRENAAQGVEGGGPPKARDAPYPPLSGILSHYFEVMGKPLGKPRQTQSDKWRKRPCVIRSREWADNIREAAGNVGSPIRVDWVASIPMPKSWSKKKKAEMCGEYHRQKPDKDNIDKMLLDSLLCEDKGVAMGRHTKFWCYEGDEKLRVWVYE